jgi:ketosteroid isomerase-like protein/catechol 2,3-dioxygenase-like lactoylglutathione lyase family enzyme
MSRENVEVVRRVFEASARGDSDAVLALYDPEVQWDASRTQGSLGEFAQVERGHEGLRRFFRRWREAWDQDEYEYEELINAGDVVLSIGAQMARGKSSGLPIGRPMAGLWTVEDGKIVRVVWYPSREEAVAALAADAQEGRLLSEGRVATRLPAQDLERARAFYSEKLGLEPAEKRPGGLLYRCGETAFALFQSAGEPSGAHTQMGWEVEDIEAVVAELRGRGVVFEEYDLPGLTTVDGIAEVEGNYPSKGGRGERAAWFRDSEGNMLGIGQRLR